MSELVNGGQSAGLRWKLLTTVSALALAHLAASATTAEADDRSTDRSIVWIELGGQLDRLDAGQQRLAPPFTASIAEAGFIPPEQLERSPLYSIGGNGKISFQPSGSDWIFSAAIQYGRNNANRYNEHQTNNLFGKYHLLPRHRYVETTTSNSETHAILDFMVGRDVGLGIFGQGGVSHLNAGIRFAQFHSKTHVAAYADPDYVNPNLPSTIVGPKYFHNFGVYGKNSSSFSGVGPSLSWDASATLVGNAQDSAITFDWSVTGAVLFGRQKSQGSHQTKGKLTTGIASFPPYFTYTTSHYTRGAAHDRSRMAVVPNIGATAGLSFRYSNAKVSFGYRADEFFEAMDGGIDTAKSYNRGFFGPFATISVGFP